MQVKLVFNNKEKLELLKQCKTFTLQFMLIELYALIVLRNLQRNK